MRIEIFKIKIR